MESLLRTGSLQQAAVEDGRRLQGRVGAGQVSGCGRDLGGSSSLRHGVWVGSRQKTLGSVGAAAVAETPACIISLLFSCSESSAADASSHQQFVRLSVIQTLSRPHDVLAELGHSCHPSRPPPHPLILSHITFPRARRTAAPHLAVIGGAGLGHGTLPVHQEAVPPPLLRQSVLVALGDVAVELALLVADGLHVLEGQKENNVLR